MTQLAIVFTLAAQVIAAIGWGHLLAERVLRWRSTIPEKGLLGLLLIATIALFLHFFLALNYWVSVPIYVIGIGMGILRISRKDWFWIIGLAMVFQYQTYISFPVYDTGLYHLPRIQWYQAEPAPFGLGNLSGIYSYNSLWLIISSSLSIPGLGYMGSFAVNTTLAILLTWFCLQKVFSKEVNVKLRWFSFAFIWLFLLQSLVLPLAITAFNTMLFPLGGPSTDFAVHSITFIGIFYLYSFFLAENRNESLRKSALFLIFAVLTKLSVAPLVLIVGFLILKRIGIKKYISMPEFIPIVFLGVIWVMQNLVVSGCVAPPFSPSCISAISWHATEQVQKAELAIKSWSRWPNAAIPFQEVVSGWSWIDAYWLPAMQHRSEIQLAVVLIVLFIVDRLFSLKHWKNFQDLFSSAEFALMMCFVLLFLFWFFTAPDYKYLDGYFVAFTAIWATLLLAKLPSQVLERYIPKILVILLGIFIVAGIFRGIQFRNLFKGEWPRIAWPALKSIPVKLGTIYMPVDGDRCYASSLLCTSQPNKELVIFEQKDGTHSFESFRE